MIHGTISYSTMILGYHDTTGTGGMYIHQTGYTWYIHGYATMYIHKVYTWYIHGYTWYHQQTQYLLCHFMSGEIICHNMP